MAGKLTAKQERFVNELIKGKSQREAYKASYNAANMSDAVIDVKASELLKNGKVSVRYNEMLAKLRSAAEEQTIMSAVEVLKEIERIAKDDISNYLDFRTEKTLIGYDKETGEAIFGYAPIVEMKDSRLIDTRNVAEVSLGANGSFKFKMYCRDAALYKLAELLGADVLRAAKQKLAEERFEHDKDIDKKRYW